LILGRRSLRRVACGSSISRTGVAITRRSFHRQILTGISLFAIDVALNGTKTIADHNSAVEVLGDDLPNSPLLLMPLTPLWWSLWPRVGASNGLGACGWAVGSAVQRGAQHRRAVEPDAGRPDRAA